MSRYLIKNEANEFRVLPIEEIFSWIQEYPQDTYYKKVDDTWLRIHKSFILHTQFVCHRINTITELMSIPHRFGIEVDIRENQKNKCLMLAHDPYVIGIDLKEFLQRYNHALLIANIKSERIEEECISEFEKRHITNYFFLDSSFPMMIHLSKNSRNTNFAVRFSEFEPLPILYSKWVWVDCFNKFPLENNDFSCNRKVCIVSPELQGRVQDIHMHRMEMIKNNITPDAICCKFSNIFEWI
jgi:hypothetical protein